MTLPHAVTTVVPVGGPVASQRDPDSRCGDAPVFVDSEPVNLSPYIALTLFALAFPAQAGIFRCTAGTGVTYQEIPCAGTGGATDIPDAYPEVNRLERDRLLQREAALEARMLKRAEIDSAERIARDDRITRERELASLREALVQRETQATGPGFLLIRPLRAPRLPARDRRAYRVL